MTQIKDQLDVYTFVAAAAVTASRTLGSGG